MARTLTEQKVLKKLGIPDFRHMTKDKVIKFASMIPKMDPEVAKMALAQFPEFAKTTKELLNYYKDVIDRALESNNECVKTNYAICNTILEALKAQLSDETLTFEQKSSIQDKMIEVAKLSMEIDKQNKEFLYKNLKLTLVALLGSMASLAAILGINAEIRSDDDVSEECESEEKDDDVIEADYTDLE